MLPSTHIERIMSEAWQCKPPAATTKFLQACLSKFITQLTMGSLEKCNREGRKSITADDLLWTLKQSPDFGHYTVFTRAYIQKYRENEANSRLCKRQDYKMQDPKMHPAPSTTFNLPHSHTCTTDQASTLNQQQQPPPPPQEGTTTPRTHPQEEKTVAPRDKPPLTSSDTCHWQITSPVVTPLLHEPTAVAEAEGEGGGFITTDATFLQDNGRWGGGGGWDFAPALLDSDMNAGDVALILSPHAMKQLQQQPQEGSESLKC